MRVKEHEPTQHELRMGQTGSFPHKQRFPNKGLKRRFQIPQEQVVATWIFEGGAGDLLLLQLRRSGR